MSTNTRSKSQSQPQQFKTITTETSNHSSQFSSNAIPTADYFADMGKRMLSSINSLLDSKLDQVKRSILETIEGKIAAVKDEIKSVTGNVVELDTRVSDLSFRTVSTELFDNELKRIHRLNEIVITGVPFVDGENPVEIYNQIARCVNVTPSPYIHAFRANNQSKSLLSDMNKAKNSHKHGGPIIVRLSCSAERSALFGALKRLKRSITLNELGCGFGSSTTIKIFESLDPKDGGIRRKANLLRKEKKLHSVRIIKGAVHVKCKQGDDLVKIHNIQQLDSLINTGTLYKSDEMNYVRNERISY